MKTIVIDMDNTLVDEFGSTTRPGIVEFLIKLKEHDFELVLWTNSSRERAKEILFSHKLNRYFSKFIFREDYDPDNSGIHKNIKSINGYYLIDDDPEEISYNRRIGNNAVLIKSYRKNMTIDFNEYEMIFNEITAKKNGIFKRITRS